MRHLVKAAAIAAGMIAFGGIGFAQCKIVVVDMQAAVTESNDGKAQAAKFDARVADWKAKLDKNQADMDTITNKLKTQSSIASQTVISDLNRQLNEAQTLQKRMTEDAQKDVDEYRDQLLNPVMQAAGELMTALATEKNYSIVYDTSAPNSPIVYSSKECDVTSEVKTRMNAKAVAASTAAAKPPAPKPDPKAPTVTTTPKPPATTPSTTTPKPPASAPTTK